jgi:AcrR family transcriptional regulator
MSKGEQTRQRILERAAPLLNRHGFQAAPVSEIMRVTGLQKGGLYNHFESKEELALAAFDLLMERINRKVMEVHRSHESPLAQLTAHVRLIASGGTQMEGGCPVANSIVESDRRNLRARASAGLEQWRLLRIRSPKTSPAKSRRQPDEVATLHLRAEGGHSCATSTTKGDT